MEAFALSQSNNMQTTTLVLLILHEQADIYNWDLLKERFITQTGIQRVHRETIKRHLDTLQHIACLLC